MSIVLFDELYSEFDQLVAAFLKLGVGTDVINWTDKLDKYKLVIAPHLYLLDGNTAEKIEKYVENGGTIVLTNRTGVKKLNNVCWMKPLPGPLSRCAGIRSYRP